MSRFIAGFSKRSTANETTLLSAWRWWLPGAAVSVILILVFVDPFVGDWDALDYTVNAVRGYPSSMALGRSLFIFYNHALYYLAHTAFGLPAERAYLVFKYAVVVQGPLAIIACWTLARDLTHSHRVATIAALLVVFSPVFILYSGQVMTEVPALLLLTLALIIHLRGLQQQRFWLVLVGAALLGMGLNLRETIGFYVPWLVFAPFVCGWPRRRGLLLALSCLVFLVFAGAGFLYWFLADPSYRTAWYGWRESMRAESALHPISIRIIWPWLVFFLATSPLVLLTLPLAFIREWRTHKLSPLFLLAAVGLCANLLLLVNYSTAIGWRYLSTGLPALVPLTSSYLCQSLTKRLATPRRAFVVSAATIVMIAVVLGVCLWPFRSGTLKLREAWKEYDKKLRKLPRDAVVISGAQTVAVSYWRGVGQGDWDVIGTGGGWPGDQLTPRIENYLKQGRRVFVDSNPRWWLVCGWQRDEIPEIVKLEAHFNFRRADGTFYEIRPRGDTSAHDRPELTRLLPENRPEDVKNCPPRPGS